MRVLAATKDMSREEWLSLRKKGIGGSDAPTIMGVNPYGSIFDVWVDKCDPEFQIDDNENMYWGRILEDVLAKEFMIRNDKRLRNRYAILQHDVHDFMLANVDRLVVGEDAGWEGKTTNAFYKDEGTPKNMYVVQCQHCMAVTGKKKWYLSVLAGGQKYYQYEVTRDDDFIENQLIPREIEFWRMVQEGEMPAFDGSDTCTNLIMEKYPELKAESIELSSEAVDRIEQYRSLTEQEKKIKELKDALANQLKDNLQGYSKGYVQDYNVYWSEVMSKRFDQKRFEEEHPELYQQYLKESSYRRFQVK